MEMPLAVMCCVRTSNIARIKPPPTAPATPREFHARLHAVLALDTQVQASCNCRRQPACYPAERYSERFVVPGLAECCVLLYLVLVILRVLLNNKHNSPVHPSWGLKLEGQTPLVTGLLTAVPPRSLLVSVSRTSGSRHHHHHHRNGPSHIAARVALKRAHVEVLYCTGIVVAEQTRAPPSSRLQPVARTPTAAPTHIPIRFQHSVTAHLQSPPRSAHLAPHTSHLTALHCTSGPAGVKSGLGAVLAWPHLVPSSIAARLGFYSRACKESSEAALNPASLRRLTSCSPPRALPCPALPSPFGPSAGLALGRKTVSSPRPRLPSPELPPHHHCHQTSDVQSLCVDHSHPECRNCNCAAAARPRSPRSPSLRPNCLKCSCQGPTTLI
ncbi:hypothetical protein N431DRAFT_455211 [Stipitochalara longipes BDJ]|nr:hypothetical protein N431DRAFT_455211 [Stipitochalara longipes BDJ]